jgi:hypothetical protein
MLGDEWLEQVAHCVGDVDNGAISENLGVGIECRLGQKDRAGNGWPRLNLAEEAFEDPFEGSRMPLRPFPAKDE